MNAGAMLSRELPDAHLPVAKSGSVVHLTAEYWPFARTGGLAEAVRGLAAQQSRAGLQVAVVSPLYRTVHEHTDRLMQVGAPFDVTLGERTDRAQIFRYSGGDTGPAIFFVDIPVYFDRDGLYGDGGGDYPDNLLRFASFCRAALHALPLIAPATTIVHAHDWHAAMACVYLRVNLRGNRFYDALASVLTVHNAAFQGHFEPEMIPTVGLPWDVFDWRFMEWHGRVNVLKGGLTCADMATTVSPTHAEELCTPEGGFGLHDHFMAMGDRFTGILNGIDYSVWDPQGDPYITANYSAVDPTAKHRCKMALQRTYGFPRRTRTPVLVMSTRLVEQKGLDLLLSSGVVSKFDAQFIFLGRGDPHYEMALRPLAQMWSDRIAVPLAFSERLEHRLLAGADVLLMPSRFEPCGLTQMRAQRYGTVPVVRQVGGLSDTVRDGETGFAFVTYTPAALAHTLRRALDAYRDRRSWSTIVMSAMHEDFSWERSLPQYGETYRRALAARRRGGD